MKLLLSALITTLVYWYTGLISPVHAQTVGLSISPPVVEILLSPNKKIIQTFNLKNQGQAITIVPTLNLVTPSDSTGHVIVNPSPVNLASIPLIAKLTPYTFGQSIPLPSGTSVALTITLEGASVDQPIDTYLALVVTPYPTTANNLQTISATPAIAGLVFITLTPSTIIPANIEISNFDPPFLHDTAFPFILSPTITNHADVMLHSSGELLIINPRDKTIHQAELENRLILKKSERTIGPLTWNPNWSVIGPHRIRLTIMTIGGTKLSQIERTIWFLPLRGLLGVLIISLILGYLFLRYRKKI